MYDEVEADADAEPHEHVSAPLPGDLDSLAHSNPDRGLNLTLSDWLGEIHPNSA